MNKTTLHFNDTIHATVTSGGRTLLNITLSGLTSMQELIKTVYSRLGNIAGLITLELRNSTMGWLERRSLKIATRIPSEAVQLTLF